MTAVAARSAVNGTCTSFQTDSAFAARGFARGTGGWWHKSLPVAERGRMLAEVGRSLNGQLRDLMARDVERLEPTDRSRT